MIELDPREAHLVQKALAIAIQVIERNDGPLQAFSDMAEMKSLLDRMVPSNDMLAHLLRSARIQIEGRSD